MQHQQKINTRVANELTLRDFDARVMREVFEVTRSAIVQK